ncbi:hypothetical protein HDV02_006370, partial [Globomyces sp. JEL0801]
MKNTTGIDDDIDDRLEEYFYFVALFNLKYRNGYKICAVCSECNDYTLPLYCSLHGSVAEKEKDIEKLSDIIPCKHVYPVISKLYYKHKLYQKLIKSDLDFAGKVISELSSRLTVTADIQTGFYDADRF